MRMSLLCEQQVSGEHKSHTVILRLGVFHSLCNFHPG